MRSLTSGAQVVKASLIDGGEQTFSQEKIFTVDKFEII